MIKQHKTLNKKLWDANNTLKREVMDALLLIVADFLRNLYLKYNIKFETNEIKDIFIYGSNTDYYYTKDSDIDICIVVNFLRLRTQNPFIDIKKFLKMCYLDWKKYHNEQIYGHPIDISFDDVYFPKHDGRHRVGPQYSLLSQSWTYGQVILSQQDFKHIKKESDRIYKTFVHKYKKLKKHDIKYKELRNLYKDITTLKNFTYAKEVNQLVSPISITWRRLRNDGIIDEMRNLMKKKRSEKLSLK